MFCPGRDGGHGGGGDDPNLRTPRWILHLMKVGLKIEMEGARRDAMRWMFAVDHVWAVIRHLLPWMKARPRCWPSSGSDPSATNVLQQVGPVRRKS